MGKITNEKGEPLPYATVFVLKIQKGTASNEEGDYSLDLPRGRYEVRFQYLGYTTQTKSINVGTQSQLLDIVLSEEPVDLQTVEVFDNKEDAAYTIMRRAIGKASYHVQQIDSYQATSYIKGSGRLKDVPGLFRKRIERELKKEGIDTSTAFVTESVSEISYTRPNQFKEKVISVRTVGEDNNTSPNNFINSSFYHPEVATAISPLSPKAFAYYRFEYLGFFADHNLNINKIKVTPRSNGDQLFEGVIYIVDRYWSIHSLDLTTSIWGIEINVNQVYEPIQSNVWLPINHIFNVNGTFFGFDFEYRYFTHIKDYQITLNPDLPEDIIVIDEKIEKKDAAQADKKFKSTEIDSSLSLLSSGKDISRKELRKLMRAYQKEELEEEMALINDTAKVDVIELTEYSIDSNAYKRDSIYWKELRPIPLTAFEIKGYDRMDSLAAVEAEESLAADTLMLTISSDGTSLRKKKGGGFEFQDVLFGGQYKVGKKMQWGWQSPLVNLHFNSVEGYHLAIPFFINNISSSFRYRLSPMIHYSFARNRINGSLSTSWSAGNFRTASTLKLEGGRMTAQYNPEAIPPLINDLASLLWERNYLKVYEQTYAKASWTKQIDEKNRVNASVIVAERRGLQNNTDHTYFNRNDRFYTSNFPVNAELGITDFDTSGLASLFLKWQTEPWLKYRLRNNRKERIEGSSPVMTLAYRVAISGVVEQSPEFHHLDFTFQHLWPIGVRGDLSIKLNAGTFIKPRSMTIIDLHHFPGNRTILTTQDPVGSFRLLDYYQFGTQSSYAALFSHYQFRKFLLTRLPTVRKRGIREAVFANLLETEGANHYMEIGYGMNYIFRILRLEVAGNFLDGKYLDWGVRIGIASNFEGLFN